MEVDQLKYFFKVAHLGHMSKAAEELNISQPALSANVRKLEAELGVELFVRRGKRLALNEYGRYVLSEAEPIIAALDGVLDGLHTMKNSAMNDVVIDGGPMYTFDGLMEAIQAVGNVYPGLTIRNESYPVSELVSKILSDEVDFAVIGVDIPDRRLERRLLSMDELVAVVSNGHRLADTASVHLRELASEQFAIKTKGGVPADYVLTSERLCMEAGFTPRIAFRSHNRKELLSCVRTFGYVMLTPINTLSQFKLDGLHIVRLLDENRYAPLWMYWKSGKCKSPQVRLVRQKVIEYFAQHNNGAQLI